MEGFNRMDIESLQDTIKTLLDGIDFETKTEINNATAFTVLQLIAKKCEMVGFVKSAETLNFYLDNYRINMISSKRKSRKEFIEAFKSLRDTGFANMTGSENLIEKIKE